MRTPIQSSRFKVAKRAPALAEGEGFEPPDLSVCGFQDRRLKPLGHPSNITTKCNTIPGFFQFQGRARPLSGNQIICNSVENTLFLEQVSDMAKPYPLNRKPETENRIYE
jgi:hypothetical protein